MNNLEFIYGLKKGESNAYSLMVDTYHNMLCVYASQLTNDPDLAKDIVQNVFIKIWRIRLKLKDDFSVKSYLYKSVYNEFLNQERDKKHILKLDKKYIDALNEVIEEDDEKSLKKIMLVIKHEIENLPPKCKQTFLLSKKEGLSNIEIAEYLNITLKAVEAHITKAFSKLRKAVGDKIEGIIFLLFGLEKRTVL